MTRTLTFMLSMVLLLSLLTVPTLTSVTAEPVPTTTMPLTTTSTTWVLTGPDGINPDYTSTHPWTTTVSLPDCISTPAPTVTTTTEPPVPTTGDVNLLAWAEIDEDNTMSVLSYPSDNFDLCADCYTNNGATLQVVPLENGPWDIADLRYLHMTVRTNMPFTITLNDNADSKPWFAAAAGTDEIMPAGGYCIVIDLFERFTQGDLSESFPYTVDSLSFNLLAAGSISVGHIAVSESSLCTEPIPDIQTTTKPSFPWDSTTTTSIILTGPDGTTNSTTLPTTTTTTSTWGFTTTISTQPPYTSGLPVSSTRPTTGTTIAPDGLIPGDMNCDFTCDMDDAFMLFKAVSSGDFSEIAVLRLADLNGDTVIDMIDAFLLYLEVSE